MNEEEVLIEVTKKLEALSIPYALTGGLAVSYYGEPRTTHDIDVVVAIEKREGLPRKLISSFSKGFYISEEGIIDALLHRTMFNIIHSESGSKVDCWILQPNPYPQSMLKRRRRAKIGKHHFYILSPEDLILTKLQWYTLSGSEKHLNDVRSIIRGQRDALDMPLMRKWAPKLSVSEYLKALL